MALSIKTDEADRLARQLSALTGETMTEAVTRSLAERLERLKKEREIKRDAVSTRIMRTAAALRDEFDIEAPCRNDWDVLWGEMDPGSDVRRS
ncbi:MAG: type II toxin-antitoxin system VapB family antitoxin [Alphaproteobacteria bacterium]